VAGALRIAASLLLLALLVAWVDPAALARQVARLQPAGWLAAAAAITLATLLGALNLHLLLRQHSGHPLREFLPVYWTAWAVGLVAPGQVGDLATVSALLQRHGIDWRGTLGRSLVDKVVSLLVMLAFTAWAALALGRGLSLSVDARALLLGLAAVATLAGLAALLLRGARGRALAQHLAEVGASFLDTVRRQPGLVALNAGLTVVKVALVGTAYWLVFRAFGQTEVALVDAVAVSTAAGLLAYLPISLNGIGPVEAAGVVLFGMLGVTAGTVVATYLVLRATVLLLAWIPAAVFLLATRPQRQH
jgi:uncharacterized membrane protein YbhN (UPF0104 family)